MLGNLGYQFSRISNGEVSCKSLQHNYTKIEKIGAGKYGIVYKAKHQTTSEIVALKKINTEKEANGFPQTALREIQILKALKHENIVSLKEVVTQQKTTYLVLEYMEHDLQALRSSVSFTPAQLRYVMYQVLKGLAYLHSKSIYHRDLKPNNILYNNSGQIKICDFGMACIFSKTRPQTHRVLIPQYRPPEIYFGQFYNCQVDIWSAGILFVELFVKQSPFLFANSESQCFSLIQKLCGTPTEENWNGVTSLPRYHDFVKAPIQERTLRSYLMSQPNWCPQLVDLIDKLLTLDPSLRITAEAALTHPFFQDNVAVQQLNKINIRRMPKFEIECNGRFEQPPQKKVKQEPPVLKVIVVGSQKVVKIQ